MRVGSDLYERACMYAVPEHPSPPSISSNSHSAVHAHAALTLRGTERGPPRTPEYVMPPSNNDEGV